MELNKLVPAKDWVKKINDFMQDYNKFSNGYTDVGAGDKNVKCWGQKTYDQTTITALNGCSITGAGIQQYKWNTQPVNFVYFKINLGSNSIGTNTSLDVIKLPFGGVLSVSDLRGGGTGWVTGGISSSGTVNVTNAGGEAVTGFVQGSLIFV